MKNKIQKFSKGDFQLIRPDVIFDETNLVLIIGEGEVYRGSFTMRANNEGRIRGLVYSSSFRVVLSSRIPDLKEIRQEWNLRMTDGDFVRDM